MNDGQVRLFLCGDVMLGRGVDQILPNPGDPALRETWVKDARAYFEMAELMNGRIERPVDFSWPWGDALSVLEEQKPDVRVINLETSVTRSDEFATGKRVHYRMNPENLPCLAVARPDVCVLANNHVLDFGRSGLAETLDSVAASGLAAAGAGHDRDQAAQPAAITLDGGARVLVFAVAMASSGVRPSWAATRDRAGVLFAAEPSGTAADELADRISRVGRSKDVVVVSVHWGSNWGYGLEADQTRFAHRLIDAGADVVHGHSSHHPRPIELYRGKLVLYGCGDFIDDYEGITGYEEYRDDLRLLYFASVQAGTGELANLTMVPMQARQLRLHHASGEDREWMREVLDRVSRDFGSRVHGDSEGRLVVRH